jgi:hypothetical protein
MQTQLSYSKIVSEQCAAHNCSQAHARYLAVIGEALDARLITVADVEQLASRSPAEIDARLIALRGEVALAGGAA